jgi:hypothetical protein
MIFHGLNYFWCSRELNLALLSPVLSCHPERHPSPALRDEVEPKDPEGVSSAMQPHGVRPTLRENALMAVFHAACISGLRISPASSRTLDLGSG